MNDVIIEFSHIYSDKKFGYEQIKSVEILNQLTNQLKQSNKSFSTSVLIDDFHVNNEKWNIDYLIDNTEKFGNVPDFVAFEGSFSEIADKVIERIPNEYLKFEYFKKDKKHVLFFENEHKKFALKDIFSDKQVYKCVTFSTAWMLCRLGVYHFPKDSIHIINQNISIESSEVISILSKKYKKIEDNVLVLLSSMGYSNLIKKIQYIYY